MTELTIMAAGVPVSAELSIPSGASGVIAFVHAAGRFDARDRAIAAYLQQHGFATLLFDLLTPEEVATHRRAGESRFDANRFGRRTMFVTDWLRACPSTADFGIGYFATGAAAAAALVAASHHPDRVKAIVSRAGRPDLAIEVLPKVRAATLFVVAEADPMLVQLNRHAMGYLQCEKRLEVVASIDRAGALAREWFVSHIGAAVMA